MTVTRAPGQVCVIPFLSSPDVRYAIFRREDQGYWQVIAGGGEGEETPVAAARREAREEAGIAESGPCYQLNTMTMVSVRYFAARSDWPDDMYVIPQYYFAVNVEIEDVRLSDEHLEFEWLDYEGAYRLLHWQSDQVARWELHERLRRGHLAKSMLRGS